MTALGVYYGVVPYILSPPVSLRCGAGLIVRRWPEGTPLRLRGICYNIGVASKTLQEHPITGRKNEMVNLTPVAVEKVKEILTQQNPVPAGLRVAVVGGGCSGFSYHMAFESAANENNDNIYEFNGLKVMVDQMSEMYLDGIQIDYIESIEGSGFKFNNPNVKSTCGCGSSFSV
jgi:iron-sulfur cluster assembly accessory protein